jgi:hypothetical protein
VSDHPTPWGLDRSYWLCRCEGFRVEAGDARIGTVEGVLFESRLDRPDVLVVRTRAFDRRRLHVHVDEVDTIVPGERRVLLTRPAPPSTSLIGELRHRLGRERAAVAQRERS